MSKWTWDDTKPPVWSYDFDTDTHTNAPVWYKDPSHQQAHDEAIARAIREENADERTI